MVWLCLFFACQVFKLIYMPLKTSVVSVNTNAVHTKWIASQIPIFYAIYRIWNSANLVAILLDVACGTEEPPAIFKKDHFPQRTQCLEQSEKWWNASLVGPVEASWSFFLKKNAQVIALWWHCKVPSSCRWIMANPPSFRSKGQSEVVCYF